MKSRRTAVIVGPGRPRATTRQLRRVSALLGTADLLVDWDTSREWLGGATALETLSMTPPTDEDAATSHIACQPAVALSGRFQDWVDEIRRGPRAWRNAGVCRALAGRPSGHRAAPTTKSRGYQLNAPRMPTRQLSSSGVGHLSRGFRLPRRSSSSGRDRRLRGRTQGSRAPQVGDTRVPVGLFVPEGGRSVVHVDHGSGGSLASSN